MTPLHRNPITAYRDADDDPDRDEPQATRSESDRAHGYETAVYCSTRFEATHHWPDAPDEVAFLRHPHRHEFHVRLTIGVHHDNRDLEFIMLKRQLDAFITDAITDPGTDTDDDTPADRTTSYSCEQMGRRIADRFRHMYPGRPIAVDVSEDGENGAIVAHPFDIPPTGDHDR